MVGRGDIDRAGLGAVSFLREDDWHVRPASQHVRDDGLMAWVKVLHHHHGNRESGRQAAKDSPKSNDAARRRGDGHDAVWLAWLGSG